MSPLPEKHPAELFKYRSFDSVHDHKDILLKKQIHFAHVDSFNDPFDCKIPLRFDLLTEEQFDRRTIELLHSLSNNTWHPDLHRKEIPLHMSLPESAQFYFLQVKGNPMFSQYTEAELTRQKAFQLSHLVSNLRVFSMAEDCSNVLMWSHYSYNHTGFCIGFNTDLLQRDTKGNLGKVEYDDYPTLKPTKREPYYIPQVLSKAKDWEYEHEWRLIELGGKETFNISGESISKVVFGCKTREKNIAEIRTIVEMDRSLSHIQLFKAQIIEHSFAIDIKPLNI